MRALALLLVLAACRAGGDDDYVIIPGGDDTIIGPLRDAAGPDGEGGDGGLFEGRVCLLVDPRAQATCAATGAGGLVVSIGTQSALTSDDGSFSMAPPEGDNLLWHVTGDAIVPSVMALSTSRSLPAMERVLFDEMLLENGVILLADQGSVFVRLLRSGAPLADATVTATPTPTYATFYDGVDSTLWDQDATGAFGVAWITGAEAGSANLLVTPSQGAQVGALVPVEQLSITYVTVAVP